MARRVDNESKFKRFLPCTVTIDYELEDKEEPVTDTQVVIKVLEFLGWGAGLAECQIFNEGSPGMWMVPVPAALARALAGGGGHLELNFEMNSARCVLRSEF